MAAGRWDAEAAAGAGTPSAWRPQVLGASSQGRPLTLWVRQSPSSPGTAPWVLVVAGQHGDELAGVLAARCWMRQGLPAGAWPERLNVAVLPVLNPDGAAAGQRLTAQEIDLNRDHLRLQTPEARALSRWIASQPRLMAVIDLHEFPAKGPDEQTWTSEDVLLQSAGVLNQDPDLTHFAQYEWMPALRASLKDRGLRSGDYRLFQPDAHGGRWLQTGSAEPHVLRNATALRGVLALLVEGRGSDLGTRHLPRRVGALMAVLSDSLSLLAQHADRLLQEQAFAREVQASLACEGTWYRQALAQASVQPVRLLSGEDGMPVVRSFRVQDFRMPRPRWSEVRPCAHVLVDMPEAWRDTLQDLGVSVTALPPMSPGTARKPGHDGSPSPLRREGWPSDWQWPAWPGGSAQAWALDMRQPMAALVGAWLESAMAEAQDDVPVRVLQAFRREAASASPLRTGADQASGRP